MIFLEIVNPQLISTNDAYYHPVRKTKSGRYMSYVCKSESLKKLQKFYEEVLSSEISDEDILALKEQLNSLPNLGIKLILKVGTPSKEIFEHDVSNYVKAIEDCLVKRIGVDDSHNTELHIEKQFSEEWKLQIVISVVPIKNYND